MERPAGGKTGRQSDGCGHPAPKNPPFNTRIREKIREQIALAGIPDLSGRMKRADR
nr:hypothetical protein [Methylorubrum zatmanii]